jgi:hypothetical protein
MNACWRRCRICRCGDEEQAPMPVNNSSRRICFMVGSMALIVS